MRFCREDFFRRGGAREVGGCLWVEEGVRNAAERKGDLEMRGVAGEGMKGVRLWGWEML